MVFLWVIFTYILILKNVVLYSLSQRDSGKLETGQNEMGVVGDSRSVYMLRGLCVVRGCVLCQ